ncbi:hypothetical protein F5X68DRAFT_2482 [Plectosphaerella plurivora]|uniref:Secreted protein n=1 Tax=Plectosphaerella plurivora TaxID=936078 RepID=A0A9P9AFJ2_9PEZI|nr:hypothetical protein F5X68DRAFT_2482 [Plectosphaerella plurivora]
MEHRRATKLLVVFWGVFTSRHVSSLEVKGCVSRISGHWEVWPWQDGFGNIKTILSHAVPLLVRLTQARNTPEGLRRNLCPRAAGKGVIGSPLPLHGAPAHVETQECDFLASFRIEARRQSLAPQPRKRKRDHQIPGTQRHGGGR